MKTGQRLAEAWPTVPTVTASAARAAGAPTVTAPRNNDAARAPGDRPIRVPMPMTVSSISPTPLRRPDLREIMSRDLASGRLPHPLVPTDRGERRVEGVDAVRHAGEIGVQRDRHDAPGFGALAVEHVELPADHLAELVGGAVRPLEHRLVVDLVAVGHRDQPAAALEAHDIGLVVVGPVADIFRALGREQIKRVPGLLQPGAEPAYRPRAGRLLDGRERAADDARLLAGRRLVEPAGIALAMPHPFPAQL